MPTLLRICLFLFLPVFLFPEQEAYAQAFPPAGMNPSMNLFDQNRDTSNLDSAEGKWKDEQARIYFKTLQSDLVRYPDTSIGQLHRFRHTQPWWGKSLGNYGSATRNLFFNPAPVAGLQLGYGAYALYRLELDSLRFYNTTRPYSAFSFMLGSKSQQNVEILHTQNISPRWNFAGRMRYLSAEGFYALQKANSIAGSLNTDYASRNERYRVRAALIYNRFKQDENGGIRQADSFLALSTFSDRRRIPVNFAGNFSGNNESPVENTWSSMDFLIRNNYSWGRADTVYNEDSTKATYRFTPRFRLQHDLWFHTERHQYEDLLPDSLRYVSLASISLNSLQDSVYGAQTWNRYDNKFSLNGFLGRKEQLTGVQVGIANRIDYFEAFYIHERDRHTYVSNYLFGRVKKEALAPGQWAYEASAQFYFTGKALGNFDARLSAGKDLGKWGQLSAGLEQTLSNAPFAWESFKTNYYTRDFDLPRTSVTQVWGALHFPKLKLHITASNYLINNYLYFNEKLEPTVAEQPFSLLQLYGRKKLGFGIFSLNSELVWQQASGGAPLHLPAFMIREQFAIETLMFKKALRFAAGLEASYETNYYADGYSPFLNQFFYQSGYEIRNIPELSAFFNFKVRNFRAYIIGGQLQQLIGKTNSNAPGYPAENALFRFGFVWILIN